MWKSKKFILAALLIAVVLVGSTAGLVLANGGDEGESQPKTLLGRVAEILNIDQQDLKDAFIQAQSEMRDEALDRHLQKQADNGRVTEEQADQYKEWWQLRPDVPIPGPLEHPGFRGGMRCRGGGHS